MTLVAALGAVSTAYANNYVVYVHGRSLQTWPPSAQLAAPTGWFHVRMTFNGSESLGDIGIQNLINGTLQNFCGNGNQCVVMCHSVGCARMLLSYTQLKDQGHYPGGILWSEAAGSAAGGSELSVSLTRWSTKLLAKIFGLEGAARVDNDIKPNTMRFGAYSAIQNQASTPIYHLAGSVNICQTLSILGLIKVKLCGNGNFPGHLGDGVVPVHSAAGYADTAAHASMNDGGAKYIFRAYEQTPLYPVDHRSVIGPLVSAASLRLGVGKIINCPNMPGVDATVPDASIVYDDGDGAVTEESSPLNMIVMCGDNMWAGAQPLYASCLSVNGCCSDFSTGSAGGCSCGETVCQQAQIARRSYYTTNNCTGTEYAGEVVSFDGIGMVGSTTTSIVARSVRVWPLGLCSQFGIEVCNCDGDCTTNGNGALSVPAAHRVYRTGLGPPPPAGTGGVVITSTHFPPFCN